LRTAWSSRSYTCQPYPLTPVSGLRQSRWTGSTVTRGADDRSAGVWNTGRVNVQWRHSGIRIARANWDLGGTGRSRGIGDGHQPGARQSRACACIGRASRQRAVERFSWDAVSQSLAGLLESVPLALSPGASGFCLPSLAKNVAQFAYIDPRVCQRSSLSSIGAGAPLEPKPASIEFGAAPCLGAACEG